MFRLLVILGWLPFVGSAADAAQVDRSVAMMGTTVEVSVVASHRAEALTASEHVLRALESAERRLSTWQTDSELSRLNAATSTWVPVTNATWEDLEAAERCRQLTLGGFDHGIGELIEFWGQAETWPTPDEVSRRLPTPTGPRVTADSQGRGRRSLPTVRLAEGAFGKGAAARRALAAVAGTSGVASIRIDLGGQVTHQPLIPGTKEQLADPRDRSRAVVAVELPEAAMATSANTVRSRAVDGHRVGHLLDARTGRPATDFGSMTVWSADPLLADCLSTGLFALGIEEGLRQAEALESVEALALVVSESGLLAYHTTGLAGRLTPLTAELVLQPALPHASARTTSTTRTIDTKSDEPSPGRTTAHRFPNPRPTVR